MPAKPAHSTTLRILAGDYKGRAFASPARATTHPMGAREKLALFNMLQPYLSSPIFPAPSCWMPTLAPAPSVWKP